MSEPKVGTKVIVHRLGCDEPGEVRPVGGGMYFISVSRQVIYSAIVIDGELWCWENGGYSLPVSIGK